MGFPAGSHHARLQPPGPEAPDAVFLVHGRETLAYQYERMPADPRVSHAFTLDVDAFGTVTRSVSLVYPRRQPAFPEQARVHATLEEKGFIHQADSQAFYCLGLPFESRSYELSGIPPPAEGLHSLEAFRSLVDGAGEIPFETQPGGVGVERRLLGRSQAFYLGDDMSAPLPLGVAESLGLPSHGRAAAFTPGLLEQVFGPLVEDALLAEGRYSFEDGLWWLPSSRSVYDPGRFFLPVEIRDPFDHPTTLLYDDHALLVRETRDALGNRMSAEWDYRTLQSAQVTDPNGNRATVRLDALGMPEAEAVMGKEGDGDGDTLDEPTARFEYDLFQWLDLRLPVFAHSLAREAQGPGNLRFQEGYVYSDGFGRVAMAKVQAEPGLAQGRNADGGLVLEGGQPVLVDTSHFRRLKTVSLSIPCVTGPFAGVSATLTLLGSRTRIATSLEPAYPWTGNNDDLRFRFDVGGVQAIATSQGQADGGLFQLDFRDERYLPFEGSGAVSSWHLRLPDAFRRFDYQTLSDVLLHLQYTAREGGEALRSAAAASLEEALNTMVLGEERAGLFRFLSLKGEFLIDPLI